MKCLTKSQYEAIAWVINIVYEYQKDSDGPGSRQIKRAAIEVIVSNLADLFEHHDKEFDRNQFLYDCLAYDQNHNELEVLRYHAPHTSEITD